MSLIIIILLYQATSDVKEMNRHDPGECYWEMSDHRCIVIKKQTKNSQKKKFYPTILKKIEFNYWLKFSKELPLFHALFF